MISAVISYNVCKNGGVKDGFGGFEAVTSIVLETSGKTYTCVVKNFA